MNDWVEWAKFTVQAFNKNSCYACAAGWPQAQVVPFPLGWTTDPRGMHCMLVLYQDKDSWRNETCKNLSLCFLALWRSDSRAITSFSIRNVNYSSCLSRQEAEFIGKIDNLYQCLKCHKWVTNVLNVTNELSIDNYSTYPRLMSWWYCEKRNLHNILPSNWTSSIGYSIHPGIPSGTQIG
jgi:hypothetical protein